MILMYKQASGHREKEELHILFISSILSALLLLGEMNILPWTGYQSNAELISLY